jgi:hypothetical protein
MSIKVTIEVQKMDFRILARWCSVMRTLNEARDLLSHVPSGDQALDDRVMACEDELKEITPTLDRVHAEIRNRLWEVERTTGVSLGKSFFGSEKL